MIFEMITCHTIAVGFIAMGLVAVKYEKRPEGFKSGLLIISTILCKVLSEWQLPWFLFLGLKDVAPLPVVLPTSLDKDSDKRNNIGYMFKTTGLFPGGQTLA